MSGFIEGKDLLLIFIKEMPTMRCRSSFLIGRRTVEPMAINFFFGQDDFTRISLHSSLVEKKPRLFDKKLVFIKRKSDLWSKI